MTTARGQSETIGSILLVAITVIAISIVAGTLFAAKTPSDHPSVRIEATAAGTNVSVEHRAGQPIHADEFEIVLQETSTRMSGTDGDPQGLSDDDARFEPGEIWRFDAGYSTAGGETVLLIYTGGDRVLLDEDTFGHEPTATTATTEPTTTAAGTTEPTGTATPTATTTATNEPPTASFTIQDAQGNKVALDATGSDDPDGTIVSYEWYEGTDTTGTPDATDPNVDDFNPNPSGQVTLVVTDDDGATDRLTKSV